MLIQHKNLIISSKYSLTLSKNVFKTSNNAPTKSRRLLIHLLSKILFVSKMKCFHFVTDAAPEGRYYNFYKVI